MHISQVQLLTTHSVHEFYLTFYTFIPYIAFIGMHITHFIFAVIVSQDCESNRLIVLFALAFGLVAIPTTWKTQHSK